VANFPEIPAEPVVCPACRGRLQASEKGVRCAACDAEYPRNQAGYLQFPVEAAGADEASERLTTYASRQSAGADRLYEEFLAPWARRQPVERLLDAGCGAGDAVARFGGEAGIDAYGIDLPKASPFWAEAGRDPARFFGADASRLPFADEAFDAVLSLGVIEHVGTVTGHCTLAEDYVARRSRYARELVRVTRPGGRILVACPNKSFPIDIHHGPTDAASGSAPVRTAIYRSTGMNVHRTWGRYHLVSYRELRRLFCGASGASGAAGASGASGASAMRAVPAKHYFSFDAVRGSVLRAGARAWVEGLPEGLREGALNPFVLAEIRR